MKKFLFALIATLLIASCGQKQGQTARIDGVELDSVVVDTVINLTEETNSPQCKVSLSLQYFRKGKNAQKMNVSLLHAGILMPDYLSLGKESIPFEHAVDSFITRYVSDYKREYAPLYREDHEHRTAYNCTYEVKTKTQNSNDDIVNYVATIVTYGGGEHAIKQTIAKNFNVKTGQLLALGDIFVSGYEESLKDMMLKKLQDKFSANNLEELQKKYIFADHEVYIPENFILGKDKLTFIYCEDEIAPHNVGEIRVEFDKSDLNKFLK